MVKREASLKPASAGRLFTWATQWPVMKCAVGLTPVHSIRRTLAVSALLIFTAASVDAKPIFGLGYDASYNSNVDLLAESERSSTTHGLFATVSGQTEGARVSTFSDLLLGYGGENRSSDGGGDSDSGALFGRGGLGVDLFLRHNIVWEVRNTLSQTLIDNLQSSADLDNTDLRNVFTTGPRITHRITPRSSLELLGDFSRTNYDQTGGIDTEDWVGSAIFEHHLSRITEVGATYEYRETEFVDLVQPLETTIETTSLFWQANRSYYDLRLSLGRGEDKTAEQSQKVDTGRIDTRLTFSSKFFITALAEKTLTTASALADRDFLVQREGFTLSSSACNRGLLSDGDCELLNQFQDQAAQLQDGGLTDSLAVLFNDIAGTVEIRRASLDFVWSPVVYANFRLGFRDSEQLDRLSNAQLALQAPDEQSFESVRLSANFPMSARHSFSTLVEHGERVVLDTDAVNSQQQRSVLEEQRYQVAMTYRPARSFETRFGVTYVDAERSSTRSTDPGGDGLGADLMLYWTF